MTNHFAQSGHESLSLVLPALNEQGSIEAVVRKAQRILQGMSLPAWEMLIVNDGSSDRTGLIADRLSREDSAHVVVLHHRWNQGYGQALKTGMRHARYRAVCYMDSDGQFDVDDLPRLFSLLDRADVVCGFRTARQDRLYRRLLSRGFNVLVRAVFGIQARDVNCGFKLVRRETLDRLQLESKQTFINAELYLKAQALGLHIVEVEVHHRQRSCGRSSIRPIHLASTLAELIRVGLRTRRRFQPPLLERCS